MQIQGWKLETMSNLYFSLSLGSMVSASGSRFVCFCEFFAEGVCGFGNCWMFWW